MDAREIREALERVAAQLGISYSDLVTEDPEWCPRYGNRACCGMAIKCAPQPCAMIEAANSVDSRVKQNPAGDHRWPSPAGS